MRFSVHTGLLLDQIGHFLSLVKSGCDAAGFMFDMTSRRWIVANAGTVIVKGVLVCFVILNLAARSVFLLGICAMVSVCDDRDM
jgi:hypothetical protein